MISENPAPSATPPTAIENSRVATNISFYALLATLTLYSLWQIPNGGNITAVAVLWVIKMVPLLIFIPGLRKRHLRTYAWLSFVVLLYFIWGVQTAFIEQARIYGIIVTVLLSILFCALVVYIRAYRNFYKTSL